MCAYLVRLHVLEARFHHADEKLACLPSVTAEAITQHLQKALSAGMYISAYVGGNLARAEAMELFDVVTSSFADWRAIPREEFCLGQCVKLPERAVALRSVQSRNAADANCAVEIYWQFG